MIVAMTLTVDKSGRLALPEPVRDRLGLVAGGDIEAIETAEGIMLKPLQPKPALKREGSFWVHTGDVDFNAIQSIEDDRNERARNLWGS